MSSDEETIDKTARVWIENGGDADGILWNYRKLYERIKELEDAQTENYR